MEARVAPAHEPTTKTHAPGGGLAGRTRAPNGDPRQQGVPPQLKSDTPGRIRDAQGIDPITVGARLGDALRPSTRRDRWLERVRREDRPSPQE